MALCKRRGFIHQASDLYGGINGFWDYGPLGAQPKKNLRDRWLADRARSRRRLPRRTARARIDRRYVDAPMVVNV